MDRAVSRLHAEIGPRDDGLWVSRLGQPQRHATGRWPRDRKYGFLSAVKTTLEIPDGVFRRAKSLAARDGKSLKQFVNEAIAAKLAEVPLATPAWTKCFGAAKKHAAALRAIDAAVAAEFERIDPEEWA